MAVVALLGAGGALLFPAVPSLIVCSVLGVLAVGACLQWRRPLLRLAGLAVLFAVLTWGHAAGVLDERWPTALAGQKVQLHGEVVGIPRHQAGASRFLLLVKSVDGHPELSGRRVELHWRDRRGQQPDSHRSTVAAGQIWSLHAAVRPPRTLLNPGGFDSARHAMANRVHGVGWVESGSAMRLRDGSGLHHWRGGMSARMGASVPAERLPFLQALTVGDTSGLMAEDWAVLRSTGLTHLVAISGFHVTLLGVVAAWLAGAAWRVLPWLGSVLPRSQAQVSAAFLGAAVYACAAGLELPAVRTVLMVAVVCLARACRRTTTVSQCLSWALLVILIADPLSMLAAGFWLSFAGVAWLAWALGAQPTSPVRDLWSAQWVATLGLTPLCVFLFGQASLIGPLINLLAIPVWSLLVVPLCVLGLLLESLHAGSGEWLWALAGGIFWPSWLLFRGISGHAMAEQWLPESGLVAVALALLGVWMLLQPRGIPGRWFGLVLWLPLLWPRLDRPPEGQLQVDMLDVGQGLAVVLRTRNHALLYDAGPAMPEGFDAGERVVVPALRALGVRQLDTLVISHGDLDHAGGAAAVLSHFPAEDVHGPAGMSTDIEPSHRCETGMQWEWDRVQFAYLHPSPFFPYAGNASSCVLQVTVNGRRLLLTGDIGHVIERELLRRNPEALRADVVQVGHHGSQGSSQGAFIRATGARLALVSAGADNRFGHPHPSVVARWQAEGAEVLDTERSGAIGVRIDEEGVRVRERRVWQTRLWH